MFNSRTFKPLEWIILGVFALITLVLMPVLNVYVPEGSALHVDNFTINVWGKYFTLAVLAISVDLLWGYTGLLSLGQCLFFALGGYSFGMYLMLMIGKLGQHKSDLPDFMVFLGYKELPAHWEPFYNFWVAAAAVVIIPGIVSYIFGYLAFRSRIRGVYFSILTQALTYAACLMFFQNDFTFGGNNGLTDFKFVLGYDIRLPETKLALYMCTVVLLILTYLGCRWLTMTKFGLIQRAVRDAENRVLFSGYSAANFKLFVFTLSGIIAGLGGALYVSQVGIINPSEMATEKSLEAVVWVAVGGRGTLVGPIVGAIGVNAMKSWATRAYPDLWLILMGGMFILVVLFLPKGIVGTLPGAIAWVKGKFRGKPAEETPAATKQISP